MKINTDIVNVLETAQSFQDIWTCPLFILSFIFLLAPPPQSLNELIFQDLELFSEPSLDYEVKVQDGRKSTTFSGEKQEEAELKARDFHSHFLNCSENRQEAHNSMLDRLVEKYGASVPHHDPRLYSRAAAHTKSIAAFSILAFPDFWGHLPPAAPEHMANRKPHIQR